MKRFHITDTPRFELPPDRLGDQAVGLSQRHLRNFDVPDIALNHLETRAPE